MKTRKQKAQQQQGIANAQPRLVKAGQVAAQRETAEAAKAEVAAQVKAQAKPKIDPALRRTPRNAVEARSMFEALFGDKAA